nr:pentatricopeptide repeat protein AaPPR199 [Agave angustifolia]
MVREEGIRLDHVSLASAISACGQERRFELGRQVHCLAAKVGLNDHVSVANVLMSKYYKGGSTDCAKRVFGNMREKNVVSWTTMISIDGDNAIRLFNSMRFDGVEPNDVTFIALIFAVSHNDSLAKGQMIHAICFMIGISSEVHVSNSLISMYAKLEDMGESRKVFDEMTHKETISWNALISGHAQNGQCEEALEVFSSLLAHCEPNQYTFGSILSVITAAQTVSLTYGQRCHCRILKLGLSADEYVSGALIDMYSKHGSIDESQRVFDKTTQKSLITWTAIISAHAKHGDFPAVMGLFDEMLGSGVEPDHITFLAVLMACGGKGMVEVGRRVFNAMVLEHGLDPWPEHYSCMVDMLGRAGKLAEAGELAKRIPKGMAFSAMQSLLGWCRVHGDVETGERAAEVLISMEPMESGAYVLMSNLYAERGDWESAARIRKAMRGRGVKKEVGYSWVDAGAKKGSSSSVHMHKFSSDDRSHPLAEEIYRIAECLVLDMRPLEEE